MAAIAAEFRLRLDGLRGQCRPFEIGAALLTLRDERKAAEQAVRRRRQAAMRAARETQRLARPPPPRPG